VILGLHVVYQAHRFKEMKATVEARFPSPSRLGRQGTARSWPAGPSWPVTSGAAELHGQLAGGAGGSAG
jgi:hypothetical protein